MNSGTESRANNLQAEMSQLTDRIRTLAENCQGNSLEILALLRLLEQQHRQIREGMFQKSLPNSRHHLYTLLRDIEEEGGWPYIERMKLRSLLENFLSESNHVSHPDG